MNAFVKTSIACVVSSAAIPNPLVTFAAISAAVPMSIDPAAARFNVGPSAAMISFVVKPARPNARIASADCDAVKMVVSPIS